jgi:hypothetical protein
MLAIMPTYATLSSQAILGLASHFFELIGHLSIADASLESE